MDVALCFVIHGNSWLIFAAMLIPLANQHITSRESLSQPLKVMDGGVRDSYLVDPASSLCLSQRLSHACLSISNLYSETANGSLKQLSFIWWYTTTGITVVTLELTPAKNPDCLEGMYLLDKKSMLLAARWWFITTFRIAWLFAGDASFKFLPYQLSMVG